MQLFLGLQADNGDQAVPKNNEAIGELANQAVVEAGEHMGMTVAKPYSRYRFQSNIVCCVMLCGIALTRNICCGMCASVEALATCLAVYVVCSHNIFCNLQYGGRSTADHGCDCCWLCNHYLGLQRITMIQYKQWRIWHIGSVIASRRSAHHIPALQT